MNSINLEIETLNNNLSKDDILDFTDISNKLEEVLKDAEISIKLSMDDNNVIRIDEVNLNKDDEILNKADINNKISNVNEKYSTNISNEKDNIVEDKKGNIIPKILKSGAKVVGEIFDSTMKEYLKKKYKWNYSVYNDGKKAIIAATQKDYKNFLKSATDSLLYTMKKIPSNTKKIIKNTKNVAIDEIYSWKDDKNE